MNITTSKPYSVWTKLRGKQGLRSGI